jgi:hypothetical protein
VTVTSDASGGDATIGEAGASGEAGSDASSCSVTVPTLENYVSDLATVGCARLQACCGLTSAQFNSALCYTNYSTPSYGGWAGTGFVVPYENGPGITYNQSAACSCLESTTTITCDLISGSTYTGLVATCLAAYGPTIALGYPCASSYECIDGYCTVTDPSDPTDASLGTCAALKSIGDSCTADIQCSYISAGAPSAYCDLTGHCAAALAAGATCGANSNCASDICEYSVTMGTVTCQSGEVFSDPLGSGGTCDYYTVPDSGAL